jgi:hypothetical protein
MSPAGIDPWICNTTLYIYNKFSLPGVRNEYFSDSLLAPENQPACSTCSCSFSHAYIYIYILKFQFVHKVSLLKLIKHSVTVSL